MDQIEDSDSFEQWVSDHVLDQFISDHARDQRTDELSEESDNEEERHEPIHLAPTRDQR